MNAAMIMTLIFMFSKNRVSRCSAIAQVRGNYPCPLTNHRAVWPSICGAIARSTELSNIVSDLA